MKNKCSACLTTEKVRKHKLIMIDKVTKDRKKVTIELCNDCLRELFCNDDKIFHEKIHKELDRILEEE